MIISNTRLLHTHYMLQLFYLILQFQFRRYRTGYHSFRHSHPTHHLIHILSTLSTHQYLTISLLSHFLPVLSRSDQLLLNLRYSLFLLYDSHITFIYPFIKRHYLILLIHQLLLQYFYFLLL